MASIITKYMEENYVTEDELAEFLSLSLERLRDLRSHHITGKQKFIDFVKPSNKRILYHIDDVMKWLESHEVYSFGSAKEDPDE